MPKKPTFLHNEVREKMHEDNRVALAELATRLDATDQDLADMRSTIIGLGRKIDDLGAKIDQRSQPQWQTYIAAAMLLGGLFFAFIAPLQEADRRAQQENNTNRTAIAQLKDYIIDKFDKRNELFVTNREHAEFRSRVDQEITRLHLDVDRVERETEQTLTKGARP